MSFLIRDNRPSSQGMFYIEKWGKDCISITSEMNAHRFRTLKRAKKITDMLNKEWGKYFSIETV